MRSRRGSLVTSCADGWQLIEALFVTGGALLVDGG